MVFIAASWGTLIRSDGPMVVHTYMLFQYTPLEPDGLLASMDSCAVSGGGQHKHCVWARSQRRALRPAMHTTAARLSIQSAMHRVNSGVEPMLCGHTERHVLLA